MTAPAKPWEGSTLASRNVLQRQPIFPGGTQSRLGTGQSSIINSGSAPTTLSYVSGTGAQTQQATPRPPPRPNSSVVSRPGVLGYGGVGGTLGYGSTGYSSYGMGSGYGSYGSSYGSYGSYRSPYSSYGGMMGYGSGYGTGYGYGSGYGSYGGYGGYGQMGAYGQVSPYGQPPLENRFIQAAEESSRPAFQSLESLVHAFGSVSMMMESTFFAIHSSFRAVLGVAENFGRMRGLLAQVFSALTIFRAVRWAFIRLLQLLRLRKPGEADKIWAEAVVSLGTPAVGDAPGNTEERSSAWPIVMFMSLIMGGPYLIWKLLKSVQASVGETSNATRSGHSREEPWMSGQSPCYLSKADYSFEAQQADELSFSAGDVIAMAPAQQQTMRNHGWMLAVRIKDAAGNVTPKPRQVGLVPINHFRTLYNKGQGANAPTNTSAPQYNNIGIPNVPVASTNSHASSDPFALNPILESEEMSEHDVAAQLVPPTTPAPIVHPTPLAAPPSASAAPVVPTTAITPPVTHTLPPEAVPSVSTPQMVLPTTPVVSPTPLVVPQESVNIPDAEKQSAPEA